LNDVTITRSKVPRLLLPIVLIISGFFLVVVMIGVLVHLLFDYIEDEQVFQLKGTSSSLFRLTPHVISILIITVALLVLFKYINIKIKKSDPLGKPKGIILPVEILVTTMEKFTVELGGERLKSLAPYVTYLAIYLFTANTFGLLGFTPPPTSSLSVTFAFGFSTFVLILYYGIKNNGMGHITGLFSPPLLTPINIIGEVAFPFTLSIRMFGNILSGVIIMTLVYTGLTGLLNFLLSLVVGVKSPIMELLTPLFVAPSLLHIYFDLFSGFIQTFVFILLSSVFISISAN